MHLKPIAQNNRLKEGREVNDIPNIGSTLIYMYFYLVRLDFTDMTNED